MNGRGNERERKGEEEWKGREGKGRSTCEQKFWLRPCLRSLCSVGYVEMLKEHNWFEYVPRKIIVLVVFKYFH